MNRVYGNATTSPTATTEPTTSGTRGRGAPIATQPSTATSTSGARKKRYRSCTRSDANRLAKAPTTSVDVATSASVAATCSRSRAGSCGPIATRTIEHHHRDDGDVERQLLDVPEPEAQDVADVVAASPTTL